MSIGVMTGKTLSTEEKDSLQRSNQKLKKREERSDENATESDQNAKKTFQPKSYKDHLVGLVPSADERAFFEEKNQVEMVEQNDTRSLTENEVKFDIQESLKARLFKLWKNTLIGKVSGKKVNFQHLDYKVRALWQPEGKLTMLEMGSDFYMF